ncbi:MAG: SH3 domain-containing protein [Clostridiales bacterium]|nr:SH3 domain-containing protein [Clostridiales bacterium]
MQKRTKIALILGAVLVVLLAAALFRELSIPRFPLPEPTATPEITPAPTAEPTPSPTPTPAPTAPPLASKVFELPVEGAAGYASISMKLRASPDANTSVLQALSPGTPFRIVSESGAWWQVRTEDAIGWLSHKYCLINLPDIVPSIVYDSTNTYSSRVVSSQKKLPGITGKGLYPGKQANNRFGGKQFIMPVLYSTALKVQKAQRNALENGETLVLYEAYRPYDAQMTIVRALTALAKSDEAVKRGISTAPWKLSWFASTRLSNHQRGCAIDVSLAKVEKTEEMRSGAYGYTRVVSATRYKMPTPIHELSAQSSAFAAPVDSKSRTAWKSATPSSKMNRAAFRLQNYCAKAGLTPLASEWWHFNDLDAQEATRSNQSTGRYTLTKCMSVVP